MKDSGNGCGCKDCGLRAAGRSRSPLHETNLKTNVIFQNGKDLPAKESTGVPAPSVALPHNRPAGSRNRMGEPCGVKGGRFASVPFTQGAGFFF